MTGKEMIDRLRKSHPEICIRVTRELDPNFRWDGDGPNPVEDGFDAYDVDVEAIVIRQGVLFSGSASLGGSYFKPDEPTGEIHGYLPQMIAEALKEIGIGDLD